MNQIVSLSGGKDSTAMLLMMLERGESVHSAVFFDTGWEFPEMFSHLSMLADFVAPIPIVSLKPAVPFAQRMMYQPVSPKGKNGAQPRFLGWGWPSPMRRWCTREKTRAIDHYLKRVPSAISCIGFADDEAHRVESQNMRGRQGRVRFPLIEWGVSEADALAYCRARGFNWSGLYDHFRRVSCFCCPLQGIRELRVLRRHFPDLWATMLKWDREMPDNRGFRDYATVRDLDARFAEDDRQFRLPGVAV